MKSRPKLSICIPTYNRGSIIGETIESILNQLQDCVELIVSDNCSTDNTRDVIIKYQEQDSRIKYYRAQKNMGADWNYLRVIELAQGEYCWLLGSDDLLTADAISNMLKHVKSNNDVYVVGLVSCDFNMVPRFNEPVLPENFARSFDFGNDKERQMYFSNALSLTAFFSFISSLIVSKDKWDAVKFDEKYNGSAWAHVMKIFGMLAHGGTVRYIHQPMLNKRGDNDYFLLDGAINRVRIDVDGYNMLASDFYGKDSLEAFHIRRIIREQTGINHLFGLKMKATKSNNLEDRVEIDRIVSEIYCDSILGNKVRHTIYKYTPFSIYRLVNSIYLPLKNILGMR